MMRRLLLKLVSWIAKLINYLLYLRFPFGGNATAKEAWVALEDKFKTKIDKWRGLVRSKGDTYSCSISSSKFTMLLFLLIEGSERFYFSRGLAYSGLRLGSGFDKPASYRVSWKWTSLPMIYKELGIDSLN